MLICMIEFKITYTRILLYVVFLFLQSAPLKAFHFKYNFNSIYKL